MKCANLLSLLAVLLVFSFLFSAPNAVLAQDETPQVEETLQAAEQSPQVQADELLVYTQYPSRMIGFGEVVTVPLKIRAGVPQTVTLSVADLPEGWDASFRGGSQIIDAAFVNGTAEASVDLRLEPPKDAPAGKHTLVVVAAGSEETVELPLSFTIAEKLPPRLSLTIDGLPTKRGTPSGTTSFTISLKNEGGEDLLVGLSASQPENIQVTVESGGQEVSEIEVAANETKNLTVKADPLVNLEAGKYPITVQATAGDVKSELELIVDVVGEGSLSVTAPDGRLSGQATAGEESPLKILLSNTGTAPLRGIELSSSEPNGWSVAFDQQQIAEIPAGESAEVTARIKPPEKAIAGDYVVTVNARPLDVRQESAEFRITVRTSTLWGVTGIGLMAVAVGVVGLAVVRFGRR